MNNKQIINERYSYQKVQMNELITILNKDYSLHQNIGAKLTISEIISICKSSKKL